MRQYTFTYGDVLTTRRKDVRNMANSLSKSALSPKSMPVPLVVFLIVALAGLVVWWGFRALSPPLQPAAQVTPANPQYTFLQEMARKCQGNIDNLSAEERQQVMQMTRGFGAR